MSSIDLLTAELLKLYLTSISPPYKDEKLIAQKGIRKFFKSICCTLLKCNFSKFWKQIPFMMIDYVYRITKKIMTQSTFVRSFSKKW